MHISYVKQW